MKRLFGGILLAVGLLIAGASGLCSLAMLVSTLGEFSLDWIGLVLLFGGPPIAVGTVMIIGGRSLLRQARQESSDLEDEPDHGPGSPD